MKEFEAAASKKCGAKYLLYFVGYGGLSKAVSEK